MGILLGQSTVIDVVTIQKSEAIFPDGSSITPVPTENTTMEPALVRPKHAGGRPPKYATPDALQKALDVYFTACNFMGKPYTITGLAIALGVSRMTLLNYRKKGGEFEYLVRRAKSLVEHSYECTLRTGTKGQIKGAIFCLKVNFGWRNGAV